MSLAGIWQPAVKTCGDRKFSARPVGGATARRSCVDLSDHLSHSNMQGAESNCRDAAFVTVLLALEAECLPHELRVRRDLIARAMQATLEEKVCDKEASNCTHACAFR